MSIPDIDKLVGSNLRMLRDRAGISLEAFSSLVNMPEIRIANIEKGEHRATAADLYIFKTALNADVKDFYQTEKGPTTSCSAHQERREIK